MGIILHDECIGITSGPTWKRFKKVSGKTYISHKKSNNGQKPNFSKISRKQRHYHEWASFCTLNAAAPILGPFDSDFRQFLEKSYFSELHARPFLHFRHGLRNEPENGMWTFRWAAFHTRIWP